MLQISCRSCSRTLDVLELLMTKKYLYLCFVIPARQSCAVGYNYYCIQTNYRAARLLTALQYHLVRDNTNINQRPGTRLPGGDWRWTPGSITRWWTIEMFRQWKSSSILEIIMTFENPWLISYSPKKNVIYAINE